MDTSTILLMHKKGKVQVHDPTQLHIDMKKQKYINRTATQHLTACFQIIVQSEFPQCNRKGGILNANNLFSDKIPIWCFYLSNLTSKIHFIGKKGKSDPGLKHNYQQLWHMLGR